LFNRLFGNAHPLYYLGTIVCLMFALVVVAASTCMRSETGVDTSPRWAADAWAMVAGRRDAQRAPLRVDAMVLTMLLHLARHFCFDHYRSFRAFSWISGVVLLWLVYVSGVNGYMLPWDRLAQFTVVATAEWFDALPVFRGALARNFILPEAITDRFFSLLQFLHRHPLARWRAVDPHPARAACAHRAAAAAVVGAAGDAARAVARAAGAEPGPGRADQLAARSAHRLVLPGAAAAGAGLETAGVVGRGRRGHAARARAAVAAAAPQQVALEDDGARRASWLRPEKPCSIKRRKWRCPSNAVRAAAAVPPMVTARSTRREQAVALTPGRARGEIRCAVRAPSDTR
jgi:hypothetical protein